MKLSKISWLILGVGIFALLFGSLYGVYVRQVSEQEALNESLSAAQATLPKLISQREGLESTVAEAKAELEIAKKGFPNSIESIDVDEKLFEIADELDLEITSLTSSEPKKEEIEGITYTITPFQVSLKGEVVDILDFVDAITMGEDFTTATVAWVDMDVPEPLTEEEREEMEEEEIEEYEKASAKISLVIYSYEGE